MYVVRQDTRVEEFGKAFAAIWARFFTVCRGVETNLFPLNLVFPSGLIYNGIVKGGFT